MAFVTNQWLKGYPERGRYHSPVPVSMEASVPNEEWAKANRVCTAVTAKKIDGDYQMIYFQETDLNELLPWMAQSATVGVREKIAFDFLINADDASLLGFMTRLLGDRAKMARLKNPSSTNTP